MTAEKESRISGTERRVDGLLARVSARRKASIERSMARPLKQELLRTGYIVLCMVVDLLLLPIQVAEAAERAWLVIVPVALVPLVYAEYRLHEKWFSVPVGAGPQGPT